MEAREYLYSVRNIEKEVKSLEREYQTLEASLIGSPRIQADKVQNSLKGNTTEEIYIKLKEISDEIEKERLKLINQKLRIRTYIELIPNPTSRTILRDRYISGLKWEEIAELNVYSEQHVYSLHKQAIKDFFEIIKHQSKSE